MRRRGMGVSADGQGGGGRADATVDIYILDTGVNVDHHDFQGRAKWGYVAPRYLKVDGSGHGTHGELTAGVTAGSAQSSRRPRRGQDVRDRQGVQHYRVQGHGGRWIWLSR
jgi:subtilisin family serine protease